jgi:hypothetical protein
MAKQKLTIPKPGKSKAPFPAKKMKRTKTPKKLGKLT